MEALANSTIVSASRPPRLNCTPVMVMAGGRGSRLGPLACHRAKPAMPFAGRYRIIDFALSNLLNSGYRRIYLLTQFMASSLIRHVSRNWRLSGMGEFVEVVPAQMRTGDSWYAGTADSVYQNLHLIERSEADNVAVFGSDHIYAFAVNQMEEAHRDFGADLTVAAFPVPRAEAHRFGVIQVDGRGRITGFQEKPEAPTPVPGQPDTCLVSMGNYIFRAGTLQEALRMDARDASSRHDFGQSIIPGLVMEGARVFAYDFRQNRIPGVCPNTPPYWRDVGTIDSFFQANMDVRSPLPAIDLYNHKWQIRTAPRHYPPARFVRHGGSGSVADVIDSMVCEGSIITSARLERVLVGYDCLVHAGSEIEDSVLMSGCDVGAGARLKRVLLDKNCSIEPGATIGHDPAADRERFPFISEGGVVVLPKGSHVPRGGPVRLASDLERLLRRDPATKETIARFQGAYALQERDLSCHRSLGPRYQRFTAGAREG